MVRRKNKRDNLMINKSLWSRRLILLLILMKLEVHKKPYRFEFVALFIKQREWPKTRPQLWNWKTCLTTKVILFMPVVLSNFYPQQSQLWNTHGELKLFVPNGKPIIVNCLCFLLHFISVYSNNTDLSWIQQILRISIISCRCILDMIQAFPWPSCKSLVGRMNRSVFGWNLSSIPSP